MWLCFLFFVFFLLCGSLHLRATVQQSVRESTQWEKNILSDAIWTCLHRDTPTLPDCFLMFSINLVGLVLTLKPAVCP